MAKNRTRELAQWFVREILQREFDYRFDGQHLKAAKSLLNPQGDEAPLDFSIVQICIRMLKEGRWDFDPSKLNSLYAVTWGTPSFYQRTVDMIIEIPPPYMVRAYDSWFENYAPIAKRLGAFDGAYQGWGSMMEIPYRLEPERVVAILYGNA